jgi:large subunit ribosomal protein L18
MAHKTSTERRRERVRRQVRKVANGRPRLSVYRSGRHIYAQVIDDLAGRTVAAASSLEKDMRSSLKTGADTNAAAEVGKLVASRAKEAGVENVVFDRGCLSLSWPREGTCRCGP